MLDSKHSRFFLRSLLSFAVTVIFVFSCATSWAQDQTSEDQYLGLWHASLRSPGGPICFGVEIAKSKKGDLVGHLINGNERIEIPSVSTGKDGLTLAMDHYDSKIVATISKDMSDDLTQAERERMKLPSAVRVAKNQKSHNATKGVEPAYLRGEWVKRRGKEKWSKLIFNGVGFGEQVSESVPQSDFDFAKVEGRWEVEFSSSPDPAVAVFKGDGATLMGTFMTTTGDYRFLAGSMLGEDRAWLSCFDGAHAFLFTMKLQKNGTLAGDFWSSNTWHETWSATRNEKAKLPDAFTQTTVGSGKLGDYKFPNLDGVETSVNDPAFAGKARLIYVFGSWCPNCHDAAVYFSELQEKYKGKDLSILGLAFELTGEHDRDAEQVRKYLKRHGCDYPVLIAGLADKKLATKSFPVLDKVRSYPTTIFVNEKGDVKAIHTGFTGPATGDAYKELKNKFEGLIDEMLSGQ